MPIPGLGGRMTAEQILGMSTDEFKAKMEGAASKQDLDALRTSTEQANTALADIQASLKALTTKPPVPDPAIIADADDPTTSLLTDPNGFVRRATQGTQATAMQARADVLEMRARNANPGIFGKYGKELMEAAKGYNLEGRCQEGFWDFLMNSFLGSKVRTGDIDAGTYPSLLGSSSVAGDGTMGRDAVDANRGFTDNQVAYFKERGIPLDEAKRMQDLMQRDGEPVDIDNYKKRVKSAA